MKINLKINSEGKHEALKTKRIRKNSSPRFASISFLPSERLFPLLFAVFVMCDLIVHDVGWCTERSECVDVRANPTYRCKYWNVYNCSQQCLSHPSCASCTNDKESRTCIYTYVYTCIYILYNKRFWLNSFEEPTVNSSFYARR